MSATAAFLQNFTIADASTDPNVLHLFDLAFELADERQADLTIDEAIALTALLPAHPGTDYLATTKATLIDLTDQVTQARACEEARPSDANRDDITEAEYTLFAACESAVRSYRP